MKHFCALSEAIREGVKLRPPADDLFKTLPDGSLGSCALGAAYEAITGDTAREFDAVYRFIESMFTYASLQQAECPEGCGGSLFLESVIIHLNDDHEWTRERIADFVEEFEESIGYETLIESESSSKSLQRAVLSV